MYNVQKSDTEHIRHKTKQLRLVQLAAEKGTIKCWHTIDKPPVVSTKYIGKALSRYEKYSNCTYEIKLPGFQKPS